MDFDNKEISGLTINDKIVTQIKMNNEIVFESEIPTFTVTLKEGDYFYGTFYLDGVGVPVTKANAYEARSVFENVKKGKHTVSFIDDNTYRVSPNQITVDENNTEFWIGIWLK